tara:strand:- start:1769 stop:1978 length:210 start_codon:yes stop_codon:yes gene_type:complete
MTSIDEYTIQTIGSKWNNGKEKKNQVITEIKSDDLIDIKKLCRFVEEYEENLTNGYTNCKVQITFTERD